MFHDLITQMLNVDPTCRPSTTQVSKHTIDFLRTSHDFAFKILYIYENLASSSMFTINRELENSALIYFVPICNILNSNKTIQEKILVIFFPKGLEIWGED